MPAYTVECSKCGHQSSVFRVAAEIQDGYWEHARFKCLACGRRTCRRIYEPSQILPDTFDKPVHMYGVRHAANPRSYPIVTSRSEQRKALEQSNQRYKTELIIT